MTRSVIEKIFADHGQKVFFADFESVKFENKAAEKNYRTVFLTYVPYFYNEEKEIKSEEKADKKAGFFSRFGKKGA